ncbi:MAG TPA: archaetidylserine decarboxylase [Steroidobacteraceae bacterium]|jgi:phosphatidylserine decarboxylase|nr:archaetidylserine decarboxylase [Steroidobacteraceae bacterium]
MTVRAAISRVVQQEDINFLLTNRIPRRWLTLFVGWLSKIENPLIAVPAIALWRLFCDVDLSDASQSRFRSLHQCFTRELKPGARPVDPDPATLVSPSDGIIGASGKVVAGECLQAKGYAYPLMDLLADRDLVRHYQQGSYVTLRLTAGMYHRFHAPGDCRVEQVSYISGDTWNVNPIAVQRIQNLFCKNERAVIRLRLEPSGHLVTLVPVAAILVASIRLTFLNVLLHLRYRGPNHIPCAAALKRGEQMGWFQHGSTIIAFVPPGVRLVEGLASGTTVRMGQPLFTLADE